MSETPINGPDDADEWRVRYTGFQGDLTPLRAATESCTTAFRAVRRAAEDGDVALGDAELRSHTAALAATGAEEGPITELATAVAERRRLLGELAPSLDAVVSLIADAHGDVAVVTATEPQASTVAAGLRDGMEPQLPHRVRQVDVQSTDAATEVIEALDSTGSPGILVGSLSALPTEARLSPSTLVFVGSIEAVPTPDGVAGVLDGDARACRVRFAVGSPHTVETRLPREDGQALLETAAQLRAAAHGVGNAIRFTSRSTAVTDAVAHLETEGAELVRDLETTGLADRDASPAEAVCLRDLLDGITPTGSTADLLGRWEPPGDRGRWIRDSAQAGDPGGGSDSAGDAAGVRDRVREWLPFGGGSGTATSSPKQPGDARGTEDGATGSGDARRAGTAGSSLAPDERSRLLAQDPYRTRVGTARRFWRSYVDESFESDPIGLARALGRDLPASVAARLDAGLWREVLRLELLGLADAIGEPPNPHDMQRYGAFPPYEYVRRFGTWNDALAYAGLEVENPDPGDTAEGVTLAPLQDDEREDALLTSLRDLAGALGTAPARIDVQKFGAYPPQRYVDVFGSWRDALAAADLEAGRGPEPEPGAAAGADPGFDPLPPSSDSTAEGALVAELGQLAAIMGSPPTRDDVKKFGEYPPQRYIEAFGSWDAALERAGLIRNGHGAESAGVTDRVLTAVRSLSDR